MINDFDFIVQLAAKKNYAMAANTRRGLLETVLQRQMWSSLREHFALSQKTPAVPEPIISAEGDKLVSLSMDSECQKVQELAQEAPAEKPSMAVACVVVATVITPIITPYLIATPISHDVLAASSRPATAVASAANQAMDTESSGNTIVTENVASAVGLKRHMQCDSDATPNHVSAPKRAAIPTAGSSVPAAAAATYSAATYSLSVEEKENLGLVSPVPAPLCPAPADNFTLSACHSLFGSRTITGIPLQELMACS